MESLSGWFERLLFGVPPEGSTLNRANQTGLHKPKPAILTLIGSGGKTSLLWLLAQCLGRPPRKTLLAPAAKLLHAMKNGPLFDHYCSGMPAPLGGLSLAEGRNTQGGKLESLLPEDLAQMAGGYDLVLFEGDGSKTLPLKGWADYEPVVPPCTGITLGILPLWPVGKRVDETIIHRLPLFSALTTAAPGEILSLAHLSALISGLGPSGEVLAGKSLFTAAQGRKILFLNQIETSAALALAQDLAGLLPAQFRSGLSAIIAGSVQQNRLQELYPGAS